MLQEIPLCGDRESILKWLVLRTSRKSPAYLASLIQNVLTVALRQGGEPLQITREHFMEVLKWIVSFKHSKVNYLD